METKIVTLTDTELQRLIVSAIEKGATTALRMFAKENLKQDELLTPAQTAEYLKVSKPTLYVYEQKGLLHAKRNGRKVWYHKQEIIDLLAK